MHSVEAATIAVASRVARLATERVALREARGRVLAIDTIATRPLPGFDNSAMDGYAARAADLPGTFPIHTTIAAGGGFGAPIPHRAVVRIFTGAPVPIELDTVVIQEHATLDGDRVALPTSAVRANIRRAGEDVRSGELAVGAGTRLGGGELGLLAALGFDTVDVVRRPRVAMIATGDELVDVATPVGPGQLVDSSSYALGALIEAAGGIATHVGIVKDDPAALTTAIKRALDHDVVVTTGGVSVGDRDHVHAAFAAAGVALELYKVAMKPGKPFSFGMAGHVPVFGLPGNPVSSFVAFELFVRPALLAMQGSRTTARPRAPVTLADGYRKQAGRAHYLRATLVRDGDRLVARAHPKQGSAMLSSLVGCNALVELAAEITDVLPDTPVPAILLEAV